MISDGASGALLRISGREWELPGIQITITGRATPETFWAVPRGGPGAHSGGGQRRQPRRISRAFVGRLRASGTGVLINVASVAAYQPIPNMAVYAATKAFVLSFTEALWQESLGTGLRVLLLSPGATRTEFNEVVGTEDATRGAVSFETLRQVVQTALRALDRRTPPPSVISGWRNRLMAGAARLLGLLLGRRRAVLLTASMTGATD